MMRRAEPEVMDVPERAAAYAQADFRDVNAAFVSRLAELAAPLATGIMLDVGTGPGDIALMASRALPRWLVVGVDASPAMLSIARQRKTGYRSVSFVLADAKHSPFAKQAFDAVYASSILHHVTDPHAFWAQLKRICKPGGLILVRDLYRPESEQAARLIVETYARGESEILKEDFYNSLLAAYTIEEIEHQLAKARLTGFHVEAITDRHADAWGIA